MESEEASRPLYRRRWIITVGVVSASVLIIGVILFFIIRNTPSGFRIPDSILAQTLFPVYVPSELPSGYTIKTQPDVNESVLLFYATDSQGHRIVFTEQPKPKEFDFTGFHNRVLRNSSRVPDAEHTSIIGESEQKTLLLSITTDETWIIVTTSSNTPHAQQHLKGIARSMHEQ